MEIWVVYENPSDYPGKYVLRRQTAEKGSISKDSECVVKDSYEELIEHIPQGKTRINRDLQDDPVIMETWI